MLIKKIIVLLLFLLFLNNCSNYNQETTNNNEIVFKHEHFQSSGNLYCSYSNTVYIVNNSNYTLFNDNDINYYIGNEKKAFAIANCKIITIIEVVGENNLTKEAHFLNNGSLFCKYNQIDIVASTKNFTLFQDYQNLYYLGNKEQALPLTNCIKLIKTTINEGVAK